MSAITGIGEKRTIAGNASASSIFGTATRTTSQPALASAAICAVVAGTSCVFVSVIDCTTTGAPPPISTPPTVTERSLATRPCYRRARDAPTDTEQLFASHDPMVYKPPSQEPHHLREGSIRLRGNRSAAGVALGLLVLASCTGVALASTGKAHSSAAVILAKDKGVSFAPNRYIRDTMF